MKYSIIIFCSVYICLDTESQLYWVQNVADPNGVRAETFGSDLGNFMKNTFVLELEYMFVQVISFDCVLILDGTLISYASP